MRFLLAEFLSFQRLVAVVKLVHFLDGVFVQVLISLLDVHHSLTLPATVGSSCQPCISNGTST